jgi:hypothetical protein
MSKRRPITIGDTIFQTATAATERVRATIEQYETDQRVSITDATFFHDMLSLHPRCEEKMGVGVIGFVIRKNPIFPNRTIHIIRADKSECDFSWPKCLNGERPEQLYRQAMRVCILPQIFAYKNRMLQSPQYCPESGVPLTSNNCDVDHQAPRTFDKLVDDWLAIHGMTITAVAITPSRDLQYRREMTDDGQIRSWYSFHQTHAQLRLLHHDAHLHQPKYKYK